MKSMMVERWKVNKCNEARSDNLEEVDPLDQLLKIFFLEVGKEEKAR